MFKFKEEYLIGISEIDKEHERLFQIADEVISLKNNEFIPDKYDQIRNILEELRDYALLHFEHEEAYMKSINYKRMFSQKIEHDEFREKIAQWDFTSIDEDQLGAIDEILTIIMDWLENHILGSDMLIGK